MQGCDLTLAVSERHEDASANGRRDDQKVEVRGRSSIAP